MSKEKDGNEIEEKDGGKMKICTCNTHGNFFREKYHKKNIQKHAFIEIVHYLIYCSRDFGSYLYGRGVTNCSKFNGNLQ